MTKEMVKAFKPEDKFALRKKVDSNVIWNNSQ